VRLAIQPSWPVDLEIGNVAEVEDEGGAEPFVLIGEGVRRGYVSPSARDEVRS
jgi:hypothetical protein